MINKNEFFLELKIGAYNVLQLSGQLDPKHPLTLTVLI